MTKKRFMFRCTFEYGLEREKKCGEAISYDAESSMAAIEAVRLLGWYVPKTRYDADKHGVRCPDHIMLGEPRLTATSIRPVSSTMWENWRYAGKEVTIPLDAKPITEVYWFYKRPSSIMKYDQETGMLTASPRPPLKGFWD